MAGYRAHLFGGATTSAILTVSALFAGFIELMFAPVVFVLGTTGGLLPDLDSDTGRPVLMLKGFLSLVVPAAVAIDFYKAGSSAGVIFIGTAITYLVVRVVLFRVFTHLTIHRGIMHSVPFAVSCGLAGTLLVRPMDDQAAIAAGFAIFLGCLTHLVIDELNSFTFRWGFLPVLKSSSGSALKMKSNSLSANLFCYSALIVLMLAVFFSV